MRIAVVDTSALLRLFVPDGPLPDGLEDLVGEAWRGDAAILAPELLVAEVAAVLRKKERDGRLATVEVDEILRSILDLPIDLVSHRGMAEDALRIARDLGLTVYDALFLALARARKVGLVTADEDLARAWSREARRSPSPKT